jgi:hypothetical protein
VGLVTDLFNHCWQFGPTLHLPASLQRLFWLLLLRIKPNAVATRLLGGEDVMFQVVANMDNVCRLTLAKLLGGDKVIGGGFAGVKLFC